MNELITAIRNNKFAAWVFALAIGVVYRFVYGRLKDAIWLHRDIDISGLINPDSQFQMIAASTALNLFAELSSAIIPALVCGIVLIYFFQHKAILFSAGAILSYLVLDNRLWRYWLDPGTPLPFKVMGFASPLIVALVLVSTIWLITKYNAHITPGSTADRD